MENTTKKAPRRQSKNDLKNALLASIQRWVGEGCTPLEAVEKLSQRQYDFLIDCDIDLDNYTLTPEQAEAVKEIKKAGRPTFPNGYSKKYPASKVELFTAVEAFIVSQGAEITPRDKKNYRDLDFTIAGQLYKIVLSVPRSKRAD